MFTRTFYLLCVGVISIVAVLSYMCGEWRQALRDNSALQRANDALSAATNQACPLPTKTPEPLPEETPATVASGREL